MTQKMSELTMISVNIKQVHKDIISQYFTNLPTQSMLYSCDVNANKLSTTHRVKYIPVSSKSLDLLVACLTVEQYLSQYCSYSCYIVYIRGHAAQLDVQSAQSSHSPTPGVNIGSIQCPQRLSSSLPHPEPRAQWVSDQVSHASPSIWRHSGPDTQLHPLKVLPPCNEVEHISCGMRWSCCMKGKKKHRTN